MVKPPPKDFIQIKKGRRYYLRCAKTIKTPLGIAQCTFIVRKDCLKREHKCQFITLDSYKQLGISEASKLATTWN